MPTFRRIPAASAAALLMALAGPAAAATFTWTNGAFVPGTTAPSPLGAADVLKIQDAAAKSFSNVSFNNGGTVNWQASSGNIGFNNGNIINKGVWDAQGDRVLAFFGCTVATNSFANSGIFRKSAGSGITQISNSAGIAFTNSGTIDAQTGTIVLNGSNTFNTGTVFTGAGGVVVNRASTFSGEFTSSNLNLAAGVQTGNAAVLNGQALEFFGGTSNSFTNNGVFKKTSGSGTTSLTNPTGLTFVNNGTVDVQVGTIQLPGAFSNAGTLIGAACPGPPGAGQRAPPRAGLIKSRRCAASWSPATG